MIVFDIDDFKQINDSYGHSAGNRCLKEIADCLKKAYSRDGLCYRIGGDEFCVLLRADADRESCRERMEREWKLRKNVYDRLPGISAGAASFRVGDDIQKVKELADCNLYKMKREHK